MRAKIEEEMQIKQTLIFNAAYPQPLGSTYVLFNLLFLATYISTVLLFIILYYS